MIVGEKQGNRLGCNGGGGIAPLSWYIFRAVDERTGRVVFILLTKNREVVASFRLVFLEKVQDKSTN